MQNLDRNTARALTEAGYMPVAVYLNMFGHEALPEAPLVPKVCDDPHDALASAERRIMRST